MIDNIKYLTRHQKNKLNLSDDCLLKPSSKLKNKTNTKIESNTKTNTKKKH